MKYLLPFLLLLASYILLVSPASAAVTPNATVVHEGWYCNGNDVWHYRKGDPAAPDVNEFDFACGNQICAPQPPPDPIYEQDVTCYDPTSLPQNGSGTTMHLPNPVTTQGDKEILGIGASKACSDQIHNDNIDGVIKVGGELPHRHP